MHWQTPRQYPSAAICRGDLDLASTRRHQIRSALPRLCSGTARPPLPPERTSAIPEGSSTGPTNPRPDFSRAAGRRSSHGVRRLVPSLPRAGPVRSGPPVPPLLRNGIPTLPPALTSAGPYSGISGSICFLSNSIHMHSYGLHSYSLHRFQVFTWLGGVFSFCMAGISLQT